MTESGDAGGRTGIDLVVGHHVDPFRSGVARFNEILAERLGVPVVRLTDPALLASQAPMFSFRLSEIDEAEAAHLAGVAGALHRAGGGFRLFLHDYSNLELERNLVQSAAAVYCGNDEIYEQVGALSQRAVRAWAPGLIGDVRPYEPTEISVFSFGMAHKIQTGKFRALKELLEESGRTYALYLSNANHETATLQDARLVYEEMGQIFPRRLYFLGNLSDIAVYNFVVGTMFFAAFFRGGTRANNTSIASAMEHGAVVITNLDRHSPPHLRHMENVIDIDQCERLPSDPLTLRQLSVRAMETARTLSWDRLVERLGAGT